MSNSVNINEIGIKPNQPLYVYQKPMFMLTVSTVMIIENGVIILEKEGTCGYEFPNTTVRAGKETIQFAAIRNIKNNIGLVLPKDSLIPVDFRSSPERSVEGNVVDIGMVCMPEAISVEDCKGKWVEVDFEQKEILNKSIDLLEDHDILLDRAIDISIMIKN